MVARVFTNGRDDDLFFCDGFEVFKNGDADLILTVARGALSNGDNCIDGLRHQGAFMPKRGEQPMPPKVSKVGEGPGTRGEQNNSQLLDQEVARDMNNRWSQSVHLSHAPHNPLFGQADKGTARK